MIQDVVQTLIFVGSYVVIIGFIIRYYIQPILKKRQLRKEENQLPSNTNQDPSPFRPLNDEERAWLSGEITSLSKLVIFVLLLSLGFLISLCVNVIPLISNISLPGYLSVLAFGLPIFAIVLPLSLFRLEPLRQYKKDLQSSVFRVQGKVFKNSKPILGSRSKESVLEVRDTIFSELNQAINIASFRKFFNSVETGDLIYIEYSPNSKHIWASEKVIQSV